MGFYCSISAQMKTLTNPIPNVYQEELLCQARFGLPRGLCVMPLEIINKKQKKKRQQIYLGIWKITATNVKFKVSKK